MIAESEALQILRDRVRPTQNSADCPLGDSLGRVAAGDLVASMPMPRFSNSMVDGYALTGCPLRAGETFVLRGEQAAGIDRGLSLAPGETIRIFTGAPLPSGTEAVAMQEDVTVLGDGPMQIRIQDGVLAGEGLRQAGDDLMAGQKILSVGDRLTPQRMALIASQGIAAVPVRPQPRVRVLSTGDELVPVGAELKPGQLYESNALMLRALGEHNGWPGWTCGHVPDDPDALGKAILAAVAAHDFVFLSGGVSVGDHDHVRPVLRALGFQEHFWRVRVQPGKPVLFGTLSGCSILGLPGNPVSSFVSFYLFAVPAICRWLGIREPPRYRAILKRPASNPGNRPHYLRGRFDPVERTFEVVGQQRSHGMLGLSLANAIARLPPGAQLGAGEEAEVLSL